MVTDYRQYANIGNQSGAGLLSGLLNARSSQGQQQLQEDKLNRQEQQNLIGALRQGINPSQLQDPTYVQKIAQQNLTRRNAIASPSLGSFGNLVQYTQTDEFNGLPEDVQQDVLDRIRSQSKGINTLQQQAFATAQGKGQGTLPTARQIELEKGLGKFEAEQQFKPQIAADTVFAKGQAESALGSDKSVIQADNMLNTIDSVLQDTSGLQESTGGIGGFRGRQAQAFPITEAQRRFIPKLEQLQGQTFLNAFESLKGGGQITEVEGKKAEQSIARLNTAQSSEDFRQALSELKQVIQGVKDRSMVKKQGFQAQPLQQEGIQQPLQQEQVINNNDPLGLR